MGVDVDRILDLIDQTHINKTVLMQHDLARGTFTLPKMVVADHQELSTYLQATSSITRRRLAKGRRLLPLPLARQSESLTAGLKKTVSRMATPAHSRLRLTEPTAACA